MKRIYVTVGGRVEHEGDKPEDKGEFLAIDWETKKIVGVYIADSRKKVEVGRSRGSTGLAWHEDKIYITCRNGIMSIDPDTYEEVSRVKTDHGGFHGMESDGHTLWLTCMSRDAILGIRKDKVESVIFTQKYGAHNEKAPREATTGVNAIGFSPSGEMFIMYSHKYHLFNWTKQKPVLPSECKNAPHDIVFMDEEHCLYTQAAKRQLWKLNVRTGTQTCVVNRGPLYELGGSEYAKPGWLRGVAYDKTGNRVFAVASPGTILEYDATTWKELDRFVFTERPKSNPFDIILDPRDWK